MTSMRIISWNVWQAGAERAGRCVAALAGFEPDVVALQEVIPSARGAFRERLAGCGLVHAVDSFELAPDLSVLKGPRRYGELVASRWPLRALPPSEVPVPWPERVLSVVIERPGGAIELHTTHIPPGVTNGWIKVETLEGLFRRLTRSHNGHRILCGDFNAPRRELPDGRIVTWAQPESGAERFSRARGERWDAAERCIVAGLAPHGLYDVFRELHGYGVDESSWYPLRKDRSLAGRRFDLLFASTSLNARSCRYLHALRECGLSDHSPIAAGFAPMALIPGAGEPAHG